MSKKTDEEIAREVSRKHGMKAKKVLRKKYGPDAYRILQKKGVRARKQK